MAYFLYGFLLVIGTCTQVVQPLPEQCSPEWDIDWNIDVTFGSILPSPGVLIGGSHSIAVPELIKFFGRLWNAKSPLELSGYVCRDYGPYMYALCYLKCDHELKGILKKTCDKIVSMLNSPSNTGLYQYCVNENLFTRIFRYHTISFLELDLATTASRVVFDVLEWLGPSPFSYDAFGGCAGLRLMSNMNIDAIVAKLTLMVSYSVADGLMYFRHYHGCDVVETDILRLIDDTLFYGQTGGICGFLSCNPSKNEYKNKAFQIIDNILPFSRNAEQCVSLMDWIMKQFEYKDESFYRVTGSNISTREGRRRFCNQVLDSLSNNTQYSPKEYMYPFDDDDVRNWFSSHHPGELLPGFYFTDAMDLLRAILNSATVIDGVNVLCTVFESFLTKDTDTTYPRRLCGEFQHLKPRFTSAAAPLDRLAYKTL